MKKIDEYIPQGVSFEWFEEKDLTESQIKAHTRIMKQLKKDLRKQLKKELNKGK
jgi:hypothetical protein